MGIKCALCCAGLILILTTGVKTARMSHLPGHARFDLGAGKRFGKNWSVTVNILNVTNGSYLLDNSPLLGGVHWVEPRQIWAEVRYKFHD